MLVTLWLQSAPTAKASEAKELTEDNSPHVLSPEMQNSALIDTISRRVDNKVATSLVRPPVECCEVPFF